MIKNLPNLKQVLAALLTIVAVMVGHQAMAADKTVTYTISYTGTNTLTATPDVAGFDGSTEVITGPAITGSNDNFGLFLHDNLNVIFNLYQSSGNRRMYVSDDGVTFTFAANITTCCSNYYIKHIAMKDHNGTAIMVYDLNAYPPTNFSFDLDVDLDKLGASSAPTTVTEHHVRTANNTTTIKTITITYGSSPRSYNISYTNAVNGQNGVTNNNRTTYSVATPTFNVTAPTRTGYDFDGFTYTDAAHPTATNATLPMSISRGEAATRKAITFNASWTPITYSISYDLAGGSVATANPTTYTVETATFTLNNPTRTGYTFAGWTGTDLNEPTVTVTIAQGSIGDRSYTATWTPITYNISYDLAGGSVATANPTTYNIETATFTLNNPTRMGYTFAGWTGTDLNGPTMNVTIAQGSIGDRSYTATWNIITYNLAYNLAGGSMATANPTTYNIETATFTLNNPTRNGYTFAGWTGTDLNGPTMNVTIAQGSIGDRSYTATWNIITYNLTYDLAGGSVATANPTTYHIETATFTLNNPTRVLSTFAGWTGTGLEEPTMNVTIEQGSTGDRSYTATWTLIPITYIDADGNQQTCTDFTIIESSESDVNLGTSGQDEWYVVSGNVTINGQLFLRGFNSHLILCDGATLNINHTNIDGLYSNQNLIIYGQSVGNGTLTASAPVEWHFYQQQLNHQWRHHQCHQHNLLCHNCG